jgi:pyrroline-5-carboxylate reductase
MLNKSIGFIGGGRVVRIILHAMKSKGKMPDDIYVSDSNEEVLNRLKNEFSQINISKENTKPAVCDYVFISLHPPVMTQVLEEIKQVLNPNSVLVSLAPKFTIAKISSHLNGFNKIVRMIPNAPTFINKGYNPVSYSNNISSEEKKELGDLFGLLGEYPEVNEKNLEAYAIITAMGPTYFWFQIKKLHELGLSFDLTEEDLASGISSMMKGAVECFYKSGISCDDVIDLIPVKPLAEFEKSISDNYENTLSALFNKLKN